MSGERTQPRRLLGYRCLMYPQGGIIPPASFTDPCGHDVAVYSDGTTEPDALERPYDRGGEES